jgi:hypothetical protein
MQLICKKNRQARVANESEDTRNKKALGRQPRAYFLKD